jgi:hypothetical protein
VLKYILLHGKMYLRPVLTKYLLSTPQKLRDFAIKAIQLNVRASYGDIMGMSICSWSQTNKGIDKMYSANTDIV